MRENSEAGYYRPEFFASDENGKNGSKMMRARLLIFAAVIMPALLPVRILHAQDKQTSSGERVVVCMIPLEYADAENLASVLNPFLSPQGSIAAYAPTNTLIIKDKASIVDMLAEIVKGKPCIPDEASPRSGGENGLDKGLP
jgi:hypothetical protein